MTKKEINTVAGQVNAACLIMHDVRQTVFEWSKEHEEAFAATVRARQACDELRKALRAISYEVENV